MHLVYVSIRRFLVPPLNDFAEKDKSYFKFNMFS